MPYELELQAALNAVREATKICRSVQATITDEILSKKDRSPVTIADYGSQAVVCKTIGLAFPDDPVIAEEDATELRVLDNAPFLHRIHEEVCRECLEATHEEICRWIDHGCAQDYSHRFWTLDPIDGTKGFLRKEQYAISLALIIDGQIQLGVLGCPNLGETVESTGPRGTLFYAIRGTGAFSQPLDDPQAPPTRIRVTNNPSGALARLCESVEAGHSAHDASAEIARRLGITAGPVRLDSQAKYGVVARGEADVYLRLPTKADYSECIWDHAGGVLVVEEAGGRVSDIHGKPLDFTHGHKLLQNQGVVVSNGALHDAVLKTIAEVF